MASEGGRRQDLIDRIAEEVAERWRRGERPTMEEYAAQHPEAAVEIREVFPTLVFMEDFGSLSEARAQDSPADLALGKNGQFGDYRILREIGRGGMGIVFEAEQLSLGRRVALKVLLQRGALSDRQIERFQLEARSAARLLHPHIVAIHDVGVEGGIHYYTMQYVAGQSLDAVLHQLRLVRDEVRDEVRAGPERASRADPRESRDMALHLLSGSFAANSSGPRDAEDEVEGRVERPERPGGGSTSAIQLPASDSSLAIRDSAQHYFRSVALIGVQVANALAYAHERGILHRDIKPSNLLLDLEGSVWVTDFGLAKAEDSEALTLSGDVVGTLRYMGPERFRGWSSPESDVYALGATLYELLTLRPLFPTSDRAALIREILNDTPVAPRRIDSRVPGDLETIVLKATEKEPGHRYASAAALRDDLMRFIEGRPIVARRTPLGERAWLWCRRNRTVASLAGAIALLLLAAALVASLMVVKLRESNESLEAERNTAVEHLWHARLAQARAGRWSLLPGQRRASLDALKAAAATRVDQEIRDEAAAAMCLADVTILETREGLEEACLSPDFDLYARPQGQGLAVRRRRDDGLVAEIPARLGSYARFSPDGKLLATYTRNEGAVWRLEGPERVVNAPSSWVTSFSADCRYAAFSTEAGVRFFDLEEKSWTPRFVHSRGYSRIYFAPAGYLAACQRSDLRDIDIADLESGETRRTLRHQYRVNIASWSADARLLATATRDRTAYLWDAGEGSLLFALEGHHSDVVSVLFQPLGFLVGTYSWDGYTRLWDVRNGRLVARCEGSWLGFDREGRRLAYGLRDGLGIAEVLPGDEYWSTRTRDPGLAAGPNYADVSPCGRWIASTHRLGLRLWDAASGRLAARIVLGNTVGVRFLPDGKSLVTTGDEGLLLWPLQALEGSAAPGRETWRLGPPAVLWDRSPLTRNVSVSADGKLAAFQQGGRPHTVRLDPPHEARSYPPYLGLFDVHLSPDGRWLVGSNWNARGVPLWSLETGRQAVVLPAEGSSQGMFSPDGGRVVVGSPAAYDLYETGTWKPVLSLKRGSGNGSLGPSVFSANGKVLCVLHTRSLLHLVDAADGREILTLEPPGEGVLHTLALSPDGGLLVATSGNQQLLHVWNLRRLAEGFDRLGIDARVHEAFEPPPGGLPVPAQRAGDTARDSALSLEVDPGVLAREERRERELLRLDGSIAEKPGDTRLLLRRSSIHLELGRFDAALADRKRALEIAPGDAGLLDALARLHLLLPVGLRDIDQALGLVEEALRLEKGNAAFLTTLGALQYRAGRFAAAAETLEARGGPAGGDTAYDGFFLSMALSRLGRPEEARNAFDRALAWIAAEEGAGTLTAALRFELEVFRREGEDLLGLAPGDSAPVPGSTEVRAAAVPPPSPSPAK